MEGRVPDPQAKVIAWILIIVLTLGAVTCLALGW
jgi:hypothetical protein